MRYILPLITVALVGGLFLVESSILNYRHARNPKRLLQLCAVDQNIASHADEQLFFSRLSSLPAAQLRPLLLVTGGFMDGLRGYSHSIARTCPPDISERCDIFYRQHQEQRAIAELITLYAERGLPTIVVGHSWGADAAVQAIRRRHSLVDLLVTLDPVSRKGPPQNLPTVRYWLNVYVDYNTASWLEQSNDIARIGGPWKHVAAADENLICSPGIHHRHAQDMFMSYALPAVRRTLQ